jgi:hypothetical protein
LQDLLFVHGRASSLGRWSLVSGLFLIAYLTYNHTTHQTSLQSHFSSRTRTEALLSLAYTHLYVFDILHTSQENYAYPALLTELSDYIRTLDQFWSYRRETLPLSKAFTQNQLKTTAAAVLDIPPWSRHPNIAIGSDPPKALTFVHRPECSTPSLNIHPTNPNKAQQKRALLKPIRHTQNTNPNPPPHNPSYQNHAISPLRLPLRPRPTSLPRHRQQTSTRPPRRH